MSDDGSDTPTTDDGGAAPTGEDGDALAGGGRDAPTAVAVGNALVDRTHLLSNLPEPDGGAHVEAYEERPGGVEANVASALRALGHEAGVIARLGDDDVGRTVLADLDDRGIDSRRVRVVADEDSSYCLVLRNRAGERMIVGADDATANLRLSGADLSYLSGTGLTFASGYAPAPVLETLAAARRDGGLDALAFDLAGTMRDLEMRGLSRETIDDVLPAVDCVLGNEAAVSSYTGGDDHAESVATLRRRGASAGAVTAGEDGATVFDGDRRVRVPAFDVDVVDTTGAGDGFSAGLIHGLLLADFGLRDAGRFAAAVGARCCTADGARGGLPTADEVRTFLDARTDPA